MITEIQTNLDKCAPLHVEEVCWNGTELLIRGSNWHFDGVTSLRAFQNFKYIWGSDDNDSSNVIVDSLTNTALIGVVAQTSSFPVDPTLRFANGTVLEIFSDAGYDTWTFGIPNQLLYDFTSHEVVYKALKTSNNFEQVKIFLPLAIKKISLLQSVLSIRGANWDLKISCSWRVIDNRSYVYGCSEISDYEILKELQNLSIVSVHNQSDYFPNDPVFFLSNGYRLEVFSAKRSEPWSMQIPNGILLGIDIT